MAEVPPPQNFVAYPRGNTPGSYGTVEQLEALGEAYFGYNILFLGAIAVSVTGFFVGYTFRIFPYFIQLPCVLLVVIFGSYSLNSKIAYGKNWPTGAALAASLLVGFNAVLCCGIIGFVVMQTIALNEIKKYGMPTGFLSFTNKKFKAFVANRRNADSSPGPIPS